MGSSFKERMMAKNREVMAQTKETIAQVSSDRAVEENVVEEDQKITLPTEPATRKKSSAEVAEEKPSVIKEVKTTPVKEKEAKSSATTRKKTDSNDGMSATKCVYLTRELYKKTKIQASRNEQTIEGFINAVLSSEKEKYNAYTPEEKEAYADSLYDVCDRRFATKDCRIAFRISDDNIDYCNEIIRNSGVKFTTYLNFAISQY
jgi:predicted DNA binding CopG/RHH family protein